MIDDQTTTVIVTIPGPVFSADRRTISIGFPPDVVFGKLDACGDGVHIFKQAVIIEFWDLVCQCGAIEAGLAVYRCLNLDVDTIVIPDVESDAGSRLAAVEPDERGTEAG